MKKCLICKETKTENEFKVNKTFKDGRYDICNTCLLSSPKIKRISEAKSKICNNCDKEKPIDHFRPSGKTADRRHPICRHCIRITSRDRTFSERKELTVSFLKFTAITQGFSKNLINKYPQILTLVKNEILSKRSSTYTYIAIDRESNLYKIGRSLNVKNRIVALSRLHPKIELVDSGLNDIENQLHYKYKDNRVKGEWFNLTEKQVQEIILLLQPKKETVTISNVDVKIISDGEPRTIKVYEVTA